jgi:hypothetical protein
VQRDAKCRACGEFIAMQQLCIREQQMQMQQRRLRVDRSRVARDRLVHGTAFGVRCGVSTELRNIDVAARDSGLFSERWRVGFAGDGYAA